MKPLPPSDPNGDEKTLPTAKGEGVEANTVKGPMERRLLWPEVEKLYVGKTFRRRKDGRQQTWRVVDCNMGGDIWVRYGRACYKRLVPQSDFLEWVKDAKEVKAK